MSFPIAPLILGILFILAGANHFVSEDFYVSIMPAYLPCPRALVYISGVAEILGGIGVLIPRMRKAAGWGLIVLLAAVFPANLKMALYSDTPPADLLPLWFLWARLPFQTVLMVIVWGICIRRTKPAS